MAACKLLVYETQDVNATPAPDQGNKTEAAMNTLDELKRLLQLRFPAGRLYAFDPCPPAGWVEVTATNFSQAVQWLRERKQIKLVTGTRPSGTPSEAKTIELIIPGVFSGLDRRHGDDIIRGFITFDGEKLFKEYLSSAQCWGLCPVDEQVTKVVRKFEQLVPGVSYTHFEYVRILRDYLQDDESDEEDMILQLTKDDKLAEHDVVINGKDKAFAGSHKTYARGAKAVKENAERCEELAKPPNELPAVVKRCYMVEPGAEPRIQKACRDLKVVRFQRSGHAIQVVNRTGAAGRLMRF